MSWLQSSLAQSADTEAPLSFERVFGSPSLSGPAPRQAKLSPDGRYLTLLRNREQDLLRYDLWGFDRESSQWRMLVDSEALGSGQQLSEAEKMQLERQRIGSLKGIVSYAWASEGEQVLVPLEGDLYLADLAGKSLRLPLPEGEKLNPIISPRGRYASFVQQGRLLAYDLQTKFLQPLTPQENDPNVSWGEAEFVAQEEMGRLTGYWWAPDDSRIAAARVDETQVGIVTRAAIGAEGTRTFEQRYPVAGAANAKVELYVIDPQTPGVSGVKVDLGDQTDIYVARVDWSVDGKSLYVQRQNRAQTLLEMLVVDPASGASRVMFSETATEGGWINLTDNYRFMDDGRLLWWSERDGFGHLYLFENGQWQQLTKGEWVVTNLAGVDEQTGRVFFTGTRDGVLEQHIYALSLATPAQIERLSESGFNHAAVMDQRGQTLMITRSSPEQPPQSYLADQGGKLLAWIEENRIDANHAYSPYLASHQATKFGELNAEDGTVLHWMMITPQLEAGKSYPVFFEHYGGPSSQVVSRRWLGPRPQAIVDRGYIYFQLDNRGSPNRGVEFEKPLFRAMGSIEVADQKLGAEYLKTLPFVDGNKIATYGWSYGGYMSLKMLEADPGLYAAGIAGAPVTKWELYDTHYTERYMGTPQTDGAAYLSSNALEEAGKIADPLLLVHGMADDNVVFENSTALAAKLQEAGVAFDMMFYPGQTHSLAGPQINAHLWNMIFTFLQRNGVSAPE